MNQRSERGRGRSFVEAMVEASFCLAAVLNNHNHNTAKIYGIVEIVSLIEWN